jgi:hypothetical protein
MEKIVRAFDARNKNRPAPTTNADEVIWEQNRLAAEHEALIRAVGEDIEQKTAREEAARAQIEADALNAATPEGARENKVRKGGPESVDAKTIKESVANLVAQEHALLARTPEGAALGKELLGGVEDQDEKNLAIARENARTERSALLAATPEGSARAKMEEDDTDGKLTREAQARIRNELRPYVDPATDEKVAEFANEELKKVRPDIKEAIERVQAKDEIPLTGAPSVRADIALAKAGADDLVTEGDRELAPPADRLPDPALLEQSADDLKEIGLVRDEDDDKESDSVTATTAAGKVTLSPNAEENKDSVNLEQNKDNPEAPPADRNPDPKVLTAPAEKKKETPKAAPKK